LCDDGTFAVLNLDPGETSKPIILGNINLAGRESDTTLIVKGLGVGLDYICDTWPIVNVTISNGSQESTQSAPIDPSRSTIEIGGKDDKWDLKNIDLTNLTVAITLTNTTLNPVAIQVKNVLFNLYSNTDETDGVGVIIDNEHSRNYSMFFGNYPDKNEGLASDMTTYDISNSQGELICSFDLKSKKIILKYSIDACTIEEVQNRLKQAAKFLSNDLNSVGLPIPKSIIFDWDPDREFMYILDDEIKVKEKGYNAFDCEATLIIPEGVGYSDLKTSGAIGTNEGLIEVRPLINLVTTGGNVQIFDNISYRSLTILNNFDEGLI
jgi:predicted phage tail component-like protein